MAPFRYDQPDAPLAGSIADLIARGGLVQAQAAQYSADAQARATALSGANWGRAVENLSQMPGQLMEQNRKDKLAESEMAFRSQQLQQMQAQQQAQQQAREGEQFLAQTIRSNQNPDTGEIDAPKVANVVSAKYPGIGEKWLALHTDAQGDLEKLATTKRAHDAAQTIAIANAANKSDDAGEFFARLGTASVTGALTPQRVAQVRRDFEDAGDWETLRQRYVQQGDEVAPRLTTKEGEEVLGGVSGKPLVPVRKKPQIVPAGASVMEDNKTVYTAPAKAPNTTPAEDKLDAYAKSLGKQDRSELSFGDIQALDTVEGQKRMALAVQQHALEHASDLAADQPAALNANQQNIAKDLASGKLTFADFNRIYPSRSGKSGPLKEAIYAFARELNPAFAPAQFEAGYKMATNPQVTQRLVAINSLTPLVDKITALVASAGNTDLPTFNKLLQSANFEIGGKHVASLRQLQLLLGDEVGTALGVGTGSDLKTKIGIDVVNPTLGPSDFLETMQNLQTSLGSRKDNLLKSMGVYGQGESAVPVAGGGSGTTVGKYSVTVAP